MDNSEIPLPQVAAALRAMYGDAPAYDRLYRAVLSGLIPARQAPGVRGRWLLQRADLPSIAEHFHIRTAA